MSKQGQILVAEVQSVNYKDFNTTGLWSVKGRLLGGNSTLTGKHSNLIARPLDTTIKKPPVKGELILVIKAPTNASSAVNSLSEYYYLQSLNVQSAINHNAIPTMGKLKGSGGGANTSTAGAPNQSSDSNETDLGDFPENEEIRPLQPYEGDTLIEGRHGQSIRLGSTITEGTDKYTLGEPQWEEGDGTHGDPITVIRNGQKDDDGFSSKPDANQYILENVDYDKSSIYLTSTQKLPITIASPDNVAYTELGFTDSSEDYTGAQVIIAGDRLIFNARENEIFMFAGGGISLASHAGVTIDSSNQINMAGAIINIGNNAESNGEPVVMGEELRKCIAEICDIVDSALQTLTTHVHGYPGTTPSPDGAGPWGQNKTDLVALRKKYGVDSKKDATWHSDYVYVNKDPDYTSEGSPDERKTN